MKEKKKKMESLIHYQIPKIFHYSEAAVKLALNIMEKRVDVFKFHELKKLSNNCAIVELLHNEAKYALFAEQVKSCSKLKNLLKSLINDELESINLASSKLKFEHTIVLYEVRKFHLFHSPKNKK